MSEQRLIDANFLAKCFKTAAERIASEQGVFYGIGIANIGAMLEDGTLGITVDAVPREEHELLVRRLEHLLESDYIRSFDEVIPLTGGKYKRDIREADRENRHGRWINESHGYRNCSECGCEYPLEDAKGFSLEDDYCPDCGAKMKEASEDHRCTRVFHDHRDHGDGDGLGSGAPDVAEARFPQCRHNGGDRLFRSINHNHDLRENHYFVIFSGSCVRRSEKVKIGRENKSRNTQNKSQS